MEQQATRDDSKQSFLAQSRFGLVSLGFAILLGLGSVVLWRWPVSSGAPALAAWQRALLAYAGTWFAEMLLGLVGLARDQKKGLSILSLVLGVTIPCVWFSAVVVRSILEAPSL